MMFLVGVAAGLLAHLTDGIFRRLEARRTPPAWVLMSRYGVGYLTTVFVQAHMYDEEVSYTRRYIALTALAAGVSVGVGVGVGHLLDYLRE